MKKISLLFLLTFAISQLATANIDFKFCDDITRVDHFAKLNSEQFKIFLKDRSKANFILVSKDRKKLYVLKDNLVIKSYAVAFGPGFLKGPKQFEGDKKTPEGLYSIDLKNPKSQFYLSLRISYPNAADKAYAKSLGKAPGGDIMIHGFPIAPGHRELVKDLHPQSNWTIGCIAVTDSEIKELYSLINEGTKIEICKPANLPALELLEF